MIGSILLLSIVTAFLLWKYLTYVKPDDSIDPEKQDMMCELSDDTLQYAFDAATDLFAKKWATDRWGFAKAVFMNALQRQAEEGDAPEKDPKGKDDVCDEMAEACEEHRGKSRTQAKIEYILRIVMLDSTFNLDTILLEYRSDVIIVSQQFSAYEEAPEIREEYKEE
jgi:acyl-CoA-binding protein